MNNFYFTFGISSVMNKYYQLIVARNYEEAEQKMFEAWGRNWAFGYSENEFAQSRAEGSFKDLKPLDPLYAGVNISVQDTVKLVNRLNQIKSGGQVFKLDRLNKLLSDIQLAYDVETDVVVKLIYSEVERQIAFAEVECKAT